MRPKKIASSNNGRLEEIEKLATAFRAAIVKCDPKHLPNTLQNFPRGACGDAALLLAKYLKDNNCGDFLYVLGQRKNHSHAWLQSNDLIVDITADQFKDSTFQVIVTEDHSWHSGFNGKVQHKADICVYDQHTVGTLLNAYKRIVEKIGT